MDPTKWHVSKLTKNLAKMDGKDEIIVAGLGKIGSEFCIGTYEPILWRFDGSSRSLIRLEKKLKKRKTHLVNVKSVVNLSLSWLWLTGKERKEEVREGEKRRER